MLSLTLQEHLHARAPPPESWEWRRRLGWGGEDVADIPEGDQEIRASALPPPAGVNAHPFRFTGAVAQVTLRAGGSSLLQGTPVTPPLISALFSPQVSQESISNKMNSSNLACVFGLNLIWPSQGASSLSALVPLNLFTELLIEYYEKVFSGRGERGAEASEQGAPGARGSVPNEGAAAGDRPASSDRPASGLARPPLPPRPLTTAWRLL